MAHFDPTNATVEVQTFKEGLLSAMGHDLKILVTRFSIDLSADQSTLTATFDPSSLKVASVLNGNELSAKDKAEIEANIRKKVLHPDKYPEIRFVSTAIEAHDLRRAATASSTAPRGRSASSAAARAASRSSRSRSTSPTSGSSPTRRRSASSRSSLRSR